MPDDSVIHDNPAIAPSTIAGTPMVGFRNVSLDYDGMLAVSDVSLSILSGEFVAIVGPSGCGKSTLLKMATGLLPASAGTVVVDGETVTRPVRGVGMAFQNATLLPWRTTLENVMLSLEVTEPFKTIMKKDRKSLVDRARKVLETVGLRDFMDSSPWQLSGGMQQRVNLCRAIVHDPSLVMLDEPFAALDAFTREDLWGVMQELWNRQRFTAMLVTHDLREAVYLADTIYVMSNRPGRIIQRREVDLPRPRTMATTFTPEYAEMVNDLRLRIADLRTSP
jgi:NitT/TauT family transport system ATP-binding protein